MTQKRIDRTNNETLDISLDKIDKNFDDVFDVEQTLFAAFTLVSQTAAQAYLNGSPNGALRLPAGLYEFETQFSLSALSATSGAFGFALGGTATLDSQYWQANAVKPATLATLSAMSVSLNSAANVLIAAASTNTVGWAYISGVFRVSVGGTVIPQISQTTAAAAVVDKNSFFRVRKIGNVVGLVLTSPPTPNQSGISWS